MKRIIAGVDGSAPSLGAATWASRRAAELDVPLEFVHILDDHDWGSQGESDWDDRERQALRLLASTAEMNRMPACISTRLLHGGTIAELAREVEAYDLLIVGSHKTGYIRGRALGSLSARLAPLVRSSLMVIPDVPPSQSRHGVVLGVGPGTAAPVVEIAVREARSHDHDLMLIASAPREHRAAASAKLDRTVAHIRALDSDLAVLRRVSELRASEALLEASRNAVLLVLGTSPVASASAGLTTHEVLMNPLSPVWIAR